MKKKTNSLEDLGGFVFSTNKEFVFEPKGNDEQTLPTNQQRLEAHLDRKNRGGKVATVIKGFTGDEQALKDLGKFLKTKCGVGGSAKDGEIIIQGDFREKVMQMLKQEGYNVKRVGG
jgi:translation initiation factor 1